MVETVAAYLGIIDIGVRLMRHYGAGRARRGLLVAFGAVASDQSLSVDQAREVVQGILRQQLGAGGSGKITDSLFVIESLVSTLQPGMLEASTSRIRPYSALLTEIVKKAGMLLDELDAFNAWSDERSVYFRTLDLGYTTAAVSRSSLHLPISAEVRELRGSAYKVALSATPNHGGRSRINGLRLVLYDKGEKLSSCDMGFSGDYEWWCAGARGLVTFELFQHLVFSILTDVINYYLRGREEIAASNAWLELIFRVRGAPRHPF
jgi:hypothetical protein